MKRGEGAARGGRGAAGGGPGWSGRGWGPGWEGPRGDGAVRVCRAAGRAARGPSRAAVPARRPWAARPLF